MDTMAPSGVEHDKVVVQFEVVDHGTQKPKSVADRASRLGKEVSEIRKRKPRSIAKLFGTSGPTTKQGLEYAEGVRVWNSEYRKKSKEWKEAIKASNDEHHHCMEFDDIATGSGDTGAEAFEDALNMLADSGWDLSNIPESEAPEGRVETMADEIRYYVSVRVRGPVARHEIFRARALAEATRGKTARLAGRADDALRHERAVDLTLDNARHELGEAGALEIQNALAL